MEYWTFSGVFIQPPTPSVRESPQQYTAEPAACWPAPSLILEISSSAASSRGGSCWVMSASFPSAASRRAASFSTAPDTASSPSQSATEGFTRAQKAQLVGIRSVPVSSKPSRPHSSRCPPIRHSKGGFPCPLHPGSPDRPPGRSAPSMSSSVPPRRCRIPP